jgi:dimethylargininase
MLTADSRFPDSVFVEDPVVVVGRTALITRLGAASRVGEEVLVAEKLASHLDIVSMAPPATLEGGDVFIVNETVYVGRSERTNQEGINQLSEIAAQHQLGVVPVDVSGVLHLKSSVLPIDSETVVVTPGTVDESKLAAFRVIHENVTERHKFSALALQTGVVIVTHNAPRTSEQVAALGQEVIPVDVSEIQAADGGLTCMSVMFPAAYDR